MGTRYKFWMVFSEGGQAPNKQHFDRDEAEKEAIRLAKKNLRPTYLLESMLGYEIPDPIVGSFDTSEVMPSEA